jgi:Holliday junction resolvasome RuvABC endonuclease subunit
MTHLALDLALGTTGICFGPDPDDVDTLTCPRGYTAGSRLEWWWSALRNHIVAVDCVVVEAPFIHPAHPSGSVPTIKLHGLVEWLCCHEQVRYHAVAPTALKKFWTGTGKANTALMITVAQERGYNPDDYGTHASDAADAIALWHYENEGGW